jgi:hypothetical protein
MGKGGGGGGGQPQQVTQTTSNLPEYARPYFENLLQRGQAESYRQYQPYEAERLAGFTPGQVAAQQETLGMQTPGQFGAATGLAGAGGLSSLGAGNSFLGWPKIRLLCKPLCLHINNLLLTLLEKQPSVMHK